MSKKVEDAVSVDELLAETPPEETPVAVVVALGATADPDYVNEVEVVEGDFSVEVNPVNYDNLNKVPTTFSNPPV